MQISHQLFLSCCHSPSNFWSCAGTYQWFVFLEYGEIFIVTNPVKSLSLWCVKDCVRSLSYSCSQLEINDAAVIIALKCWFIFSLLKHSNIFCFYFRSSFNGASLHSHHDQYPWFLSIPWAYFPLFLNFSICVTFVWTSSMSQLFLEFCLFPRLSPLQYGYKVRMFYSLYICCHALPWTWFHQTNFLFSSRFMKDCLHLHTWLILPSTKIFSFTWHPAEQL